MQCAGALWALRAVLYSSQLVYSSTSLVPGVEQLLGIKSLLYRQLVFHKYIPRESRCVSKFGVYCSLVDHLMRSASSSMMPS